MDKAELFLSNDEDISQYREVIKRYGRYLIVEDTAERRTIDREAILRQMEATLREGFLRAQMRVRIGKMMRTRDKYQHGRNADNANHFPSCCKTFKGIGKNGKRKNK